MNLSIIIPTIGRDTLKRTLDSIKTQPVLPQEVLVIGDGPQPAAEQAFTSSGLPGRYVERPKIGCWGNPHRTWAARQAAAEWLAFMDDDDIYLPGAMLPIRKAIEQPSPAEVNLFRFYGRIDARWYDRTIRQGNVSTQMIVVSKSIAREVPWEAVPGRGSDAAFIAGCAGLANRVAWHEDLIARLRP